MPRHQIVALLLGVFGSVPVVSGQRLVFFDADGGGGQPRGCYVFDAQTGSSTLLAEVGPEFRIDAMTPPTTFSALALDSDTDRLYRLDFYTGTLDRPETLSIDGVTGIAQRWPFGRYALTAAGDLYRIQPGMVRVGNVAPVSAGLTFSVEGALYGFDGSNGDLFEIDPATALVRLGGSGDPVGAITDAAATWDGGLFVGDSDGAIFAVDLDGRRTKIGETGLGGGLLGLMPEPPPCDPCDCNCDGRVDAFDIEPFVALGKPEWCSPCAGDADGNGVVDAFDIEPFIACLLDP